MTGHSWGPTASLESLKTRARVLACIRTFFAQRTVLEVETPTLSRAANTDINIRCFSLDAGHYRYFLHTSPEYPMKRLLAAGSGDIYQICKVFRDGELGALHNPEFTLLEWYRIGWDHWRLMDEIDELLAYVIGEEMRLGPSQRLSYREAFRRHAGLDPFDSTEDQFINRAADAGLNLYRPMDHDAWLDLLLSQVVATAFPTDRFTYLYDYPASQAALAKIRIDEPAVAERFEVFLGAVELANGYHELTDVREQRSRFALEQQRRRQKRLNDVPYDSLLLEALEHGMPDCSGVAVGLDRLVMAMVGARHIDEVLAFSWDRV